jgi:hypothetical protein
MTTMATHRSREDRTAAAGPTLTQSPKEVLS